MQSDWVDSYVSKTVLKRDTAYKGRIWDVIHDTFELGPYTIERDYVRHMGAVAILAINSNSELLTIRQYRQPVGAYLIEIPAGLLDSAEEEPLVAAQRELLEEAKCVAAQWSVLADFFTSPGSTSEAVRIYLAEDIRELESRVAHLDDEESEIETNWVQLEKAIDHIQRGEWQSPTLVLSVLAYSASLATRASDSEWPARSHLVRTNRVHKFHEA